MLRKVLYWVCALLFVWYIAKHQRELLRVIHDVQDGIWYWMLAAALFQVGHYAFHALAIREAFIAMKIKRRRRDMMALNLGALALNVVAPSMNISGVALMVDDARKEGHSSAAALVASFITILVDGVVFLSFAAVVLLTLVLKRHLQRAVTWSFVTLLAFMLAIMIVGLYFWRHPERLRGVLKKLRLKKADLWADEWQSVTQHQVSGRALLKIIGIETVAHFCNFFSLNTVFLAFHISAFSLLPALSYTMGVLIVILSPSPMGIGFVEGAMTLTLSGQGVPLATASAIAIAYRGLAFWLPFVIGFFFLHRIQKNPEHGKPA